MNHNWTHYILKKKKIFKENIKKLCLTIFVLFTTDMTLFVCFSFQFSRMISTFILDFSSSLLHLEQVSFSSFSSIHNDLNLIETLYCSKSICSITYSRWDYISYSAKMHGEKISLFTRVFQKSLLHMSLCSQISFLNLSTHKEEFTSHVIFWQLHFLVCFAAILRSSAC